MTYYYLKYRCKKTNEPNSEWQHRAITCVTHPLVFIQLLNDEYYNPEWAASELYIADFYKEISYNDYINTKHYCFED